MMRKHERSHRNVFRCTKCLKSFKRLAFLKTHEKKCKSSEEARRFDCRHCTHTFHAYDALYDHVVANHPLNLSLQSGRELEQEINNKVIENNVQNFEKDRVNDDIIENVHDENEVESEPVQNIEKDRVNDDIIENVHNEDKVDREPVNDEETQEHQFEDLSSLSSEVNVRTVFPNEYDRYDLLTLFC